MVQSAMLGSVAAAVMSELKPRYTAASGGMLVEYAAAGGRRQAGRRSHNTEGSLNSAARFHIRTTPLSLSLRSIRLPS